MRFTTIALLALAAGVADAKPGNEPPHLVGHGGREKQARDEEAKLKRVETELKKAAMEIKKADDDLEKEEKNLRGEIQSEAAKAIGDEKQEAIEAKKAELQAALALSKEERKDDPESQMVSLIGAIDCYFSVYIILTYYRALIFNRNKWKLASTSRVTRKAITTPSVECLSNPRIFHLVPRKRKRNNMQLIWHYT